VGCAALEVYDARDAAPREFQGNKVQGDGGSCVQGYCARRVAVVVLLGEGDYVAAGNHARQHEVAFVVGEGAVDFLGVVDVGGRYLDPRVDGYAFQSYPSRDAAGGDG